MTKPVDVLDRKPSESECSEYAAKYFYEQGRNEASAAIAELIAADVEYDKARTAVEQLRDGKSTLLEVVTAEGHLQRVAAWRAEALKAIQGENVGGRS